MRNKEESNLRKKVGWFLGILLLGGLGGILMDRLILPYLSTIPIFKNWQILSPAVPIVITKREEIRINEGVNYAEILSRVKNTLATIYVHEGELTSKRFKLLGTFTGVIVTEDGILVTPTLAPQRSEARFRVRFSSSEFHEAEVLTTDPSSGLTFLKIVANSLPVVKQGFSQELQAGERVLALWTEESQNHTSLRPTAVLRRSLPMSSISQVYTLGEWNAFLDTDLDFNLVPPGAIVLNKDAAMVGLVSKTGNRRVVLRSEDFKQILDNFLDDRKINWPSVKVSYQMYGESQTKLLDIPRKNVILIKTAPFPLREGDLVYAVDERDLSLEENFQAILLAKKPGEKVKLKVIRDTQEMELELTL